MNREIIDWLLEGPAWVRYATQLQLLDVKPDLESVLQDDAIARIVHRLRSKQLGIPALVNRRISCEQAANAYWDLFFLADIGLSASDLNLNQDMEHIFSLQLPDGAFITEAAMEPDYFCVSAILLSSIAKMGYRGDPRLGKYVQVILGSQPHGGGWHCSQDYIDGYSSPGGTSCPMDNLNVLMLLSQYGEYKKDPRMHGAIDLLLKHWERRDEKWRIDGFSIGRRFMSLQYPAVKYGILRVLDVLSLFPYAVKSRGFQSMLDFVCQKSHGGKYLAQPGVASYAEFDFGQDKVPSRWITFLVQRIEKRVTECMPA